MGGSKDTAETARQADPLTGKVLGGRYEVRELLSEGGMGRVYRGFQLVLERPVAIKCIHPQFLTSEEIVSRFMAEARVASNITHPNIVRIYDFGRLPVEDGGQMYIVMELLQGDDLATVLASGEVMSPRRIASILGQVLNALGEAHAHGVTHRDAKPENIYLEDHHGHEDVKLIDFGIAKMHGAQRVTSSGHFVGTPHYMPPEQIRGEPAEVSSDLYAVGVILFQMLTGELPFDDEQITRVLDWQLRAPRPDPRIMAPERDIPDPLAEVCLRSIDRSPDNRYPDAESFALALREAVRQSEPPRDSGRVTRSPSQRPPRPASEPPVRDLGRTPFEALQEIDIAVGEAVARGDGPGTVRLLSAGIDRARELIRAGEAEIGTAAWVSFGRRLGEQLRQLGDLMESETILTEIVSQTGRDEPGRPHVLEQLALTLRATGDVQGAEARRLEAMRLADIAGDRDLVLRMRELARAMETWPGRRGASSAPPRVSSPPPRQSEWRVKKSAGVGPGGERRRRIH